MKESEWLIIGAGYTGLSAARKLAQLHPNQKIILIDAQLAGEGASTRNSDLFSRFQFLMMVFI